MATSAWTTTKFLDSTNNLALAVNYTWGSWNNNQITFTINSTKWTGSITGAKTGTLTCDGIYSKKILFNIASGVHKSSGTSTSCSGSRTVSSNLAGTGSIILNFTLVSGSKTVNFGLSIAVPAISYGNPSGSTSVTGITQTTANRSAIVTSWGSNASAGTWSWTYGPGNYNYNSGSSANATLKNLQPNTTYNYKFYIKNKQGKTKTYTGTFKTKAYVPPVASISVNSVTNTSITMNYTIQNAGINRYDIFLSGAYYRTDWTTATSGTFTIGGLMPKTTYTISITPWGDIQGSQTAGVNATTYPNPVAVNTAYTYMTEVLPFNAKVTVASTNAGDTDSYGYTLLSANKTPLTSETRSTSSLYNFTGLTPETTYYARVRVFTKVSGVASAYYDIQFTTPPDQASVFIKVNNLWRRGKVFLKTKNAWIKSKYIYTKVDGQWRKNNNF